MWEALKSFIDQFSTYNEHFNLNPLPSVCQPIPLQLHYNSNCFVHVSMCTNYSMIIVLITAWQTWPQLISPQT